MSTLRIAVDGSQFVAKAAYYSLWVENKAQRRVELSWRRVSYLQFVGNIVVEEMKIEVQIT